LREVFRLVFLHLMQAGELGCLWSHVRLWRHAYENNYQRIMIFEDDVFLNETALPLLEGMFR
jgi:glycosyl transferase family 25